MTLKKKEIQLVFQPSTFVPELRTTGSAKGLGEKFVATLEELVGWFKDFRIDSIELWLEGGAKEGNLTKLFISFEGKGGCKVTLKPRQ